MQDADGLCSNPPNKHNHKRSARAPHIPLLAKAGAAGHENGDGDLKMLPA